MDQQLLLTLGLGVVFVVMIVFMFRNSRKRQRDQADMQQKLVPGAEVMTSHGIYGTLISLDEDKNEAVIETTPGTRLRLHRQTISRVVEPETPAADDAVEETPKAQTVLNGEPIDSEPEYGERTDEADAQGRKAGE